MSKARLPAIASVSTGNVALDRWVQSVTEILQVREGSRGDKAERAITVRDLEELGLDTTKWGVQRDVASASGVLVRNTNGTYSTASLEEFSTELRRTTMFRDLKALVSASDDTGLPDEIVAMLRSDLAAEARERGAAVSRLENAVQSATSSLASRVERVTAAVEGSIAGVRQSVFATATDTRATAGIVDQLIVNLDGTGSATAQDSLIVIADRTAGLRAQKVLKLTAGNTVAGIGLLATEDPGGTSTSAFLVEAGQFGVMSAINFSQATTPSATAAGQYWYNTTAKTYHRSTAAGTGSWSAYTPASIFSVNTTTGEVFINGSLKVTGTGASLSATATPGPSGTRGSVSVNITGPFTASAAAARVVTVTGTDPVVGDICYYTGSPGGAQQCTVAGNPGTWAAVTAFIDGSLVASGTISAGVKLDTTGYVNATGEIANASVVAFSNARTTGSFVNSTAATASIAPVGVYGQANTAGPNVAVGVLGYSANGIGVFGNGFTAATFVGKVGITGNTDVTGTLAVSGAITASGNITAYQTSDIRYKENITPITNPIGKLKAIRGVSYDWRDSYLNEQGPPDPYFNRKHEVGVIAQEVQAVLPEIVGKRPNGMLAVKYDRLTALLIEAVKELTARVEELERK